MEFQWVQLYIGLAAAAIGYFVRLFFDKKKELQGPVNLARREVYKKFINVLVTEIKGSERLRAKKNILMSNESRTEEDVLNYNTKEALFLAEIEELMYDFFIDYMLYASPDVINAFGNYRQYVFRYAHYKEAFDERKHTENLSKLIYEMRDDLGLSNKKLGVYGEDTLRGILVKYPEIFK